MTTTYKILSAEQTGIYCTLLDLADCYQDATDPAATQNKGPDPLSENDFSTYAHSQAKPFSLALTDNTGITSTILNPKIISEIWRQCCLRDQDANGTIDEEFIDQDLVIFADPANTSIELMQDMVRTFGRSVFAVKETLSDNRNIPYEGTGWVFKKLINADRTNTYHIITNAHVVNSAGFREGAFYLEGLSQKDNQLYPATLLGVDVLADVAVLEITTKDNLQVCEPADTAPTPGDIGIELGNTRAMGVVPAEVLVQSTATGMGYYAETDNDNYPFAIYAITGPVRGGNSGSPIFDSTGHVFAMHHAGHTNPDEKPVNAFVIPISRVQAAYDNIMANQGTGGVVYGDWGLYPTAIPAEDPVFRQITGPYTGSGIRVSKVLPNSPAATAGLEPGDVIVGAKTENTIMKTFTVANEAQMHRFLTYMLDSKTGETQQLTVFRPTGERGQGLFVDLVPNQRLFVPPECFETGMGFNVIDPMPFYTDKLNVNAGNEQGVLVYRFANKEGKLFDSTNVHPAISGLMQGMKITAVNGVPTPTVQAFATAWVQSTNAQTDITLTIRYTPAQYLSFNGGIDAIQMITIRKPETGWPRQ